MTRAEIIAKIAYDNMIPRSNIETIVDEYDRLVVESFGADVPPIPPRSRCGGCSDPACTGGCYEY